MPLTRLNFVALCREAIASTRDKITISNQLSGYVKFHKENKRNYLGKILRVKAYTLDLKDFVQMHALIEHAGLGNCQELAWHLFVELGQRIDAAKDFANITTVKSAKADHGYLEVRIQLDEENSVSVWEVDAWDPRIIDTSPRPDGSIKNKEALAYGYKAIPDFSCFTDEMNYSKHFQFTDVPKPQEGPSEGDCTPVREMLTKHEHLYSDYTLDNAVAQKKIPSPGKLHYLQKASIWQKAPNSKEESKSEVHRSKKMRFIAKSS